MTDEKNGKAPNLSPEQQQLIDVLSAAMAEVYKGNHAYFAIVFGTKLGAGFEHMYAAPDLNFSTEVLHSKVNRFEKRLSSVMDQNESRQRLEAQKQAAAAAAAANEANNDNGQGSTDPKPTAQ